GLTLEQALHGPATSLSPQETRALKAAVTTPKVRQWLLNLDSLLWDGASRIAMRNLPELFLPTDRSSPLGIKGLRCALADWLDAHTKEKALSRQWYNRIQNLTQKGLKQGEMDATGIRSFLLEEMPDDIALDGDLLRAELSYSRYRLSIIPVVKPVAD